MTTTKTKTMTTKTTTIERTRKTKIDSSLLLAFAATCCLRSTYRRRHDHYVREADR